MEASAPAFKRILLKLSGEALLGDLDYGADLDRAQRARGVGREEGVAGTGREDHDAPLLEVPDRASPDVRLGHRAHLDRGEHARLQARLLERILEGEGVDDRREHAHVVGRRPVHAVGARRHAPEDVAAADHDGNLDAQRRHLTQLPRDPFEHQRIDPVALAPGERLARDLQDDTAVRRACGARTRRHGYPASPT